MLYEDWNCYREYAPELVMSQFNKLITQLCAKPSDEVNMAVSVVDKIYTSEDLKCSILILQWFNYETVLLFNDMIMLTI